MQKPATVEIRWRGSVWSGVVVGGRGVLTSDDGDTYAGGVAGGTFDGRAVVKWSNGYTSYCELAAGDDHGYREAHSASGGVYYYLHERGNRPVHYAVVFADGNCRYDDEYCGADHAGLAALKAAAQQATVRPPQPPPPLAIRPRRCGGLCASCMCACAPQRPSRIGEAALRARARARACACTHTRARSRACAYMHTRARWCALLCVGLHLLRA